MPVTLAIDAMSGDHGLKMTVPAALSCLHENRELNLILVGAHDAVMAELHRHRARPDARLAVQDASQVVAMDELPSRALRGKKDSSMRVALDLVKSHRAQGVVSAGNTGALMATARFVLKTLPGIERPAIFSAIPSINGHVHMLDLGANAECSAEQLFQFAVMGSALITALLGIERPTVALLNIGSEEIKGNQNIKRAAALLQQSTLNYTGFVEGDGIFLSRIDLVVCDGFVGNVALKTGEGVAKMIRQFMQEEFSRNLFTKLAALAAVNTLKSLGKRIDPRRYNGATLLGLNGCVIKSHGSADALAFANAIDVGVREVQNQVPERVMRLLAASLPSNAPSRPWAAPT